MKHEDRPLSKERKDLLQLFQRDSQIHFKDLQLLNKAFTHRSYSHESDAGRGNNERLEFLGDSVLGLIAASELFTGLLDKSEGDLARIKSFIVSEESLSRIAKELGIDRYLLIGKGEEHSGGRTKKAILADAMEAVIGAYYLDSGFAKAQRFVLRALKTEIDRVLQNKHQKDYKTILQEFAQKRFKVYPQYKVLKKEGPDHDRTFWMTVSLDGRDFGPESGKNKKEAEQLVARLACEGFQLLD
jgi:ribonuclease-3